MNKLPVFETIRNAWHKVKGTKATFFLVVVVLILLSLASQGIEIYLKKNGITFAAITIVALIVFVFFKILYAILSWGLIYFGSERASGANIQFNMIRYVFDIKLFIKMIGLYILQLLIILPTFFLLFSGIILYSFKGAPPIQTYISILLGIIAIILMIYLTLRMYLSRIIVVTTKINPWQAIKSSFKATKNNVWRLLGLSLLNTIILFLSILPLCIGLIWAMPYLFINYGVVYKTLMNPTSKQNEGNSANSN